MLTIIIVTGVLLLTGTVITAILLYRNYMRRQMLQVMMSLANNYIHEIGALATTTAIMEKHADAIQVLDDVQTFARSTEEIQAIRNYRSQLNERREKSIIRVATAEINLLLNKADKENRQDKKQGYLMQARKIACEGLCEHAEQFINAININLVRMYMVEAGQAASKLLEQGKKSEALKTYERALGQLLSVGIPDEELDKYDDVAQAITRIEEIERELSGKGPASPGSAVI
jgi:hypothetical protein